MLFRKFIEEEGNTVRKLFEEDCCSNLNSLQLLELKELTDNSELILSLKTGI